MSDIGELTERLRAAHDAYTLAAREYNSARGAWLKAMPDAMNAEGVSASDCMAECVRAGHGLPSDFGFCRQALDQYEPCDCGLRGCPMDKEPESTEDASSEFYCEECGAIRPMRSCASCPDWAEEMQADAFRLFAMPERQDDPNPPGADE